MIVSLGTIYAFLKLIRQAILFLFGKVKYALAFFIKKKGGGAMLNKDAIRNLFDQATSDEDATYICQNSELHVTKNDTYSNAKSFCDKIMIPFIWFTSKTLHELFSSSGAQYHLLFEIEKKCIDEKIGTIYHGYYFSIFGLKRFIYKLIVVIQNIFYRNTDFHPIALLRNTNGISGELLKRKTKYYIVYHSNKKHQLMERGIETLITC